jgi:hypothetical protein
LVLAQQSIREMTRTERTAQQVMDEAVFGVFEVGYDKGFGSDADHLKARADVDVAAKAGFTWFTIDPSDHVDDTVDAAAPADLDERFKKLIATVPGAEGGRGMQAFLHRGSLRSPSTEASWSGRRKYNRAIAQRGDGRSIRGAASELELSVDETDSPTSVVEHLFIAREIRNRGIHLNSLAPRFVGAFEKGVDYKGDLAEFEARLRDHVEIARHFGPYKISMHSGSDKLLYPIVLATDHFPPEDRRHQLPEASRGRTPRRPCCGDHPHAAFHTPTSDGHLPDRQGADMSPRTRPRAPATSTKTMAARSCTSLRVPFSAREGATIFRDRPSLLNREGNTPRS